MTAKEARKISDEANAKATSNRLAELKTCGSKEIKELNISIKEVAVAGDYRVCATTTCDADISVFNSVKNYFDPLGYLTYNSYENDYNILCLDWSK